MIDIKQVDYFITNKVYISYEAQGLYTQFMEVCNLIILVSNQDFVQFCN